MPTLTDALAYGELAETCAQDAQTRAYQQTILDDFVRPVAKLRLPEIHRTDLFVLLIKDEKYNLAVFQGSVGKPRWLIKDSPELLLGILTRNHVVMPVHCVSCDSNDYLTWVAPRYEFYGHRTGDKPCLAAKAMLYSTPIIGSPARMLSARDAPGVVQVVAPGPLASPGPDGWPRRWYRVRLKDKTVGFVLSTDLDESVGACDWPEEAPSQ